MYSFLGIGKWKSSKAFELNFLPLNNFWAEGAKIMNDNAFFYGKLGMRPSVSIFELAD